MRCALCKRIVKQNPVYYRGKLYGASCARKRGFKDPMRIRQAESTEFQLDLFNPFQAFDNWANCLEW